jgi:hypothetical protein
MIRKISIIPAVIFIAASCSTSREMSNSGAIVSPFSVNAPVSEGSLIYGLPQTVLDIEVEAERIIEKPGPYSKYAAELLGLSDVIKSENEYWEITGVNISSHQELDPGQFYAIEASGTFLTNVLELKRSGLILDINPEIYNSRNRNEAAEGFDLSRLHIYDLGSDEYFLDRKDTVYKVVNVDTAFVRIPYLIEKKQKLNLDQLAEKAAVRLMELRDGKHLILTGETNVFPQNEAALAEMNRLEKEYTELFTGKIFREKQTFKYQLVPKKEMIGRQNLLCMFSENAGPSSATDKQGTPVTVEFIPELKTNNLNVKYIKDGKGQNLQDKLFYRVPDVVNIRIAIGNKALNTSRKLVYQFGEVIRMPQNYILGK